MAKVIFDPKKIIPLFDRYLGQHKLSFSAIAVGGAALSILGLISRGTRDLDLLEPKIPTEIEKAAQNFAAKHYLSEDWLNASPSSLIHDLPAGWRNQLQELYKGKNLKLSTLSRIDLIRIKLWAMCDRMRDIEDLIAIAPNEEELTLAAKWVKPLDANPGWPDHVDQAVGVLRDRLRHG